MADLLLKLYARYKCRILGYKAFSAFTSLTSVHICLFFVFVRLREGWRIYAFYYTNVILLRVHMYSSRASESTLKSMLIVCKPMRIGKVVFPMWIIVAWKEIGIWEIYIHIKQKVQTVRINMYNNEFCMWYKLYSS